MELSVVLNFSSRRNINVSDAHFFEQVVYRRHHALGGLDRIVNPPSSSAREDRHLIESGRLLATDTTVMWMSTHYAPPSHAPPIPPHADDEQHH
jgi:hypothetical protein